MKKILVIILVVAVSMCFVACSSVSSATNERRFEGIKRDKGTVLLY